MSIIERIIEFSEFGYPLEFFKVLLNKYSFDSQNTQNSNIVSKNSSSSYVSTNRKVSTNSIRQQMKYNLDLRSDKNSLSKRELIDLLNNSDFYSVFKKALKFVDPSYQESIMKEFEYFYYNNLSEIDPNARYKWSKYNLYC